MGHSDITRQVTKKKKEPCNATIFINSCTIVCWKEAKWDCGSNRKGAL